MVMGCANNGITHSIFFSSMNNEIILCPIVNTKASYLPNKDNFKYYINFTIGNLLLF